MAGYITFRKGDVLMWTVDGGIVGEITNPEWVAEVRKIQVDGDELTLALDALGLDPSDHDPEEQTFVGPAARAIARKICPPFIIPTQRPDRIDSAPTYDD